jgi:SAM-dependent methyltransferase
MHLPGSSWLSGRLNRSLGSNARRLAGLSDLIEGQTGLEIGGPSPVFRRRGLVPVYPRIARLDNCNFSPETIWEGHVQGGESFRYDPQRAPGTQFFAEATQLSFARDNSYDFVLSSHTLEHSANPLKALHEWRRVLKAGGRMLIVLPHKDATFDHRRPVTSLAHLIEDFERDMGEDDLTHLPEILALHDLARDRAAGTAEQFAARSAKNFENRCLHQHVFDTARAVELMDRAGLQILEVEAVRPLHILVVALDPGDRPAGNARFLGADSPYRSSSPFASDQVPQAARS